MQHTTIDTRSPNAPRWSSLLFRGIVSILFAIAAFAWPGKTLAILVLLFGAYAFADGITALVLAVQRGGRPHRWYLVVDGLLGVAAGVATLFWPGITLLALVFVVGIRFILSGALQVATSIQLKRELEAPVLYGLGGVCSIILGVLAFIVPGMTALVLVTMLAAFALVFGIVMLVVAFRTRHPSHRGTAPVPA